MACPSPSTPPKTSLPSTSTSASSAPQRSRASRPSAFTRLSRLAVWGAAVFNWLRKLLGPPAAQVKAEAERDALAAQNQQVNKPFTKTKTRHEAAQTDEDNRRHWANADIPSAAAANSPAVRQVLRNRSRYEYENGAYCNGIIRTRADDLVGTGPTLQILTDDDAVNDQIENAFARWAEAAGFAEALHTMDQSRCREGEAFALLMTNPRIENPVQLCVYPVEADRVTDPRGRMDGIREADGSFNYDGIRYDTYGNPLSYTILRQHPGDQFGGFLQESDTWDAEFVLHWFRKDRAAQVRGVPELTSALPLFPYQRRWTLATLSAAEFAASQAAVLKSNGPPEESGYQAVPFGAIEIERGMFTELPAGLEMQQLKAEHPSEHFAD